MYYDELRVGQTARFSKTITEADILLFSAISGDHNPVHVDGVVAAESRFGERIAHGMLSASLLCGVYGTKLPGTGAVHLEQSLRFTAPVRIGDTVTALVEVVELRPKNRVRVRSQCIRQDGVVAIDGESLLLVPSREGEGLRG